MDYCNMSITYSEGCCSTEYNLRILTRLVQVARRICHCALVRRRLRERLRNNLVIGWRVLRRRRRSRGLVVRR